MRGVVILTDKVLQQLVVELMVLLTRRPVEVELEVMVNLMEDYVPKAIMPGKHGMSFKPFTLLFNRLHLYL